MFYNLQAFDYVKKYGVEASSTYSYNALDGTCQYTAAEAVANISGYYQIPSNNENQIIRALAYIGPVTIGVDATYFQFYSSGVYSGSCSKTSLNHGITIVGYDMSVPTNPFYIVKNRYLSLLHIS